MVFKTATAAASGVGTVQALAASQLVGYQLWKGQSVSQQWGPSLPPPPIPEVIAVMTTDLQGNPARVEIHSAQLGFDYYGFVLKQWLDDSYKNPPRQVFPSNYWMQRFTDAEYDKINKSNDMMVRRYWETMMGHGEIDVLSSNAVAAKQYWVTKGLLTQARADVVWAIEPA